MYSLTLNIYPLNCLHTYKKSFGKHNHIHEYTTMQVYKHVYIGDNGIRLQAQSNTWTYNLQCYKNCTYNRFVHLYTFASFLARWANIHPYSRTISPISRGIRPCAFAVRWIFCLCKWNHQDFISFHKKNPVLPISNP